MELKQLLEILDLPEDIAESENIEEAFKGAFQKKYLTKEQALNDKDVVGKVTGKFMGPLNTKLKQAFGLTESDIKEKRIEEIIDIGVERYNAEKTSLSEAAKQGNDEKVTSLTEMLEKANKEKKKYKEDLDRVSHTLTEKETQWQGELKNYKIKTLFNSELNKVKFKDDLSPVEREGYSTIISKKYKYDLDENDNLIVRNEKDEPIQNPKKVGSYYSPYEILELEAVNNKVAKLNNANASGNPVKTFTATTTKTAEGANGRKVAPAALGHSETLKNTVAK